MIDAEPLCADLRAIYEFEITHGNTVRRVDRPAGTNCPYAVIFVEGLKIFGTIETGKIPNVVRYWESKDRHYSSEAGFVCNEHHHVVAGPIVD